MLLCRALCHRQNTIAQSNVPRFPVREGSAFFNVRIFMPASERFDPPIYSFFPCFDSISIHSLILSSSQLPSPPLPSLSQLSVRTFHLLSYSHQFSSRCRACLYFKRPKAHRHYSLQRSGHTTTQSKNDHRQQRTECASWQCYRHCLYPHLLYCQHSTLPLSFSSLPLPPSSPSP